MYKVSGIMLALSFGVFLAFLFVWLRELFSCPYKNLLHDCPQRFDGQTGSKLRHRDYLDPVSEG